MKVSIVIPVYNEIDRIGNCLESLKKQTIQVEVIVVDDGSTDGSEKFAAFKQNHQGPGAARNLGASKANGEILVFVDADMEFEPDFVEKLIAPIVDKKSLGTFSKEEYLLNKESSLARCWNLNQGRNAEKMLPDNYPDNQNVFRAVLKDDFDRVNGFDTEVGYTDDWSLSRKLGVLADAAPGAKYYHANPENWNEIWKQARWYGKNEFLTGGLIRKLFNLFRYFPVFSIFKGLFGAIRFEEPMFFYFKVWFDTAVFISVIRSFFGEKKFR